MKMQEFKLTPIEQKVIALSIVGILERNGIKDHGVDDWKLAVDVSQELMTQAGKVIPSREINDHVINEMRSLLPLFSEGYGK
ncbi:hypothetical protein P4261_28265 [Bacillus thuringiensis]|nr:hypothetical protein [Bacillus thuringiensis]MED2829687.1 hypothetical protein [Bacillus thuringiensis]MED2856362.1 hypothetical protein [Bacillus thuringiensis]MED2863834.1 hypothetical protein [Bacillus thuringiensis]